MKQVSAIFGCEGLRLNPSEKAFFRDLMPWGFILFSRKFESKGQVSALVGDFKDALGFENIPVCIDHEGGCVARRDRPTWRRSTPRT